MANQLLNLLRTPFEPLLEAVHGYNLRAARGDAIAGMTVAAVAVPQSMAYALIAGVPVQYGLYTVVIQCFIGSLFNSQRFLSVGPINSQSLLVASTVTRLVEPGNPQVYLELVIGLTCVKGVLQLAMAGARLGKLVRYVSQSVIVGFTAGAGVLIAAGQLHWFLGFPTERTAQNWPGLGGILQRLVPSLDQFEPWSIGIGLLAIAIVLVSRRISRFMPGPLLAVVVTAALVPALGLTKEDLPLVQPLPSAGELLHLFEWPPLDLSRIERLLGGALALSLLGLMEAYSIGKTIASRTGDRISANQELFSQGLANFTSSFFQCIPGSGSFSRSALNYYAGAATAISGIFNSAIVALVFVFFSGYARYIPMATLAAILFIIAYGLIDWRYLRRVARSNRADAIVCLGTLAATLFWYLDQAVFIGVFLNIALYLRKASQLHIAEMVRTSAGPFVERPLQERKGQRRVLFLQIEGDLFFGVADELRDALAAVAARPVRVVIFRLKRTHSLDSTVLQVFDEFARQMRDEGRHVIFCGLRPELHETMRRFGLVATIGEENVFETGFGVFTSAKRAIDRAKQLVGSSIDTSDLDLNDDMEGWAYEI